MTQPPRFFDRRLRMQQLRFLDALDRSRSLSAAARTLGLSQPALTKALHELEDTVGTSLFERRPQGVTPTPAGEVMIRFAVQTLSELHRLDDELDQLGRPGGGLVVLGAFPVAAAGLLPAVVRKLRARLPDLEIRLMEGRVEVLLPKLAAGELDLVLGRLYPPDLPDGLEREVLYEEPISLIARADHPIFAGPAGLPPDISGYDLILPTFSQRIGREIEHFLAVAGLAAFPTALRSTSHLFIREMLHDSDMITVSPRVLLASDLKRGLLRVVPVAAPSPSRPAGLILNPMRTPSASLRLALDAIREAVADLVGEPQSGITAAYGGGDRSDGASARPGS